MAETKDTAQVITVELTREEAERESKSVLTKAQRLAYDHLRAERDELKELVRDLAEAEFKEPCWFDHHGYCQAHGWFDTEAEGGRTCPIPRAKALLSTQQQEGSEQ